MPKILTTLNVWTVGAPLTHTTLEATAQSNAIHVNQPIVGVFQTTSGLRADSE